MMWSRCLVPLGLLCLLSAITGCGRAKGDVHGRVIFQDRTGKTRPVASGSVMVIGGDSLPYYGPIQQDGSFTISGVPTGQARATVSSPDPRGGSARGATKGRRGDPDAGVAAAGRGPQALAVSIEDWFPIPAKYADPQTSGLSLTISAGMNPFEILLTDESR
jgi:hypothetical protein